MNQEGDLCWFHGKVSRDSADQIIKDGMLNQFIWPFLFCCVKLRLLEIFINTK